MAVTLTYPLTTDSGLLLLVLAATTIVLPFLLRPNRLSRALGLANASLTPYLQRLAPHYWFGYALAALAIAHALVSMLSGLAGSADHLGL